MYSSNLTGTGLSGESPDRVRKPVTSEVRTVMSDLKQKEEVSIIYLDF